MYVKQVNRYFMKGDINDEKAGSMFFLYFSNYTVGSGSSAGCLWRLHPVFTGWARQFDEFVGLRYGRNDPAVRFGSL